MGFGGVKPWSFLVAIFSKTPMAESGRGQLVLLILRRKMTSPGGGRKNPYPGFWPVDFQIYSVNQSLLRSQPTMHVIRKRQVVCKIISIVCPTIEALRTTPRGCTNLQEVHIEGLWNGTNIWKG